MEINASLIDKIDALLVGLIGQLISQAMMILNKKKITIMQSLLRFTVAGGIAVLTFVSVPSGFRQLPVVWLTGYLAYPICQYISNNSGMIIEKLKSRFYK